MTIGKSQTYGRRQKEEGKGRNHHHCLNHPANTNVACAVCPKRPTYLRFPHTQFEGRERKGNWPTSGFLKPVCEKKGRKRFFNPIYSYVGEFGKGRNILVLCGGIVLHKEKRGVLTAGYRQNR